MNDTVRLLTTGTQLGELEQQGRPLRVRLFPMSAKRMRALADQLRGASVLRAAKRSVGSRRARAARPSLGQPAVVSRAATVRTEHGELVAYVYIDLLADTNLLGYVEAAQRDFAQATESQALRLEAGERIEWTGQYQLMVSGKQRLKWILPLVALSMLGLLFLQFRSLIEALIVLVSVPFALVGSVWTLFFARLSAVRAGLGGVAFGRGPGHANRRRHGRVHR